jgi:MtaA/CmuA family methyltransferase
MNSRERVRNTLAGLDLPRFPCGPLSVHVTATLAGVSIEDYTLKPDAMVDCICRYHERFQPDAAWLSADTWVLAEAMGAAVAFPGKNQPMSGIGNPLVKAVSDIDAIPRADPSTQGRLPLMIEAMEKLRNRLGDDVFIVACFDQSPFSLACALGGMSEMMMKAVIDLPFVEALMDRCAEFTTAYAIALGHAGADLLSTGDSPAGLLSPEQYRNIALPFEQRVFQAVKERCGVPASLHICGDAAHLLVDMATSGTQVLEIDHLVDLETACKKIPEAITIWGNIDPVGVIEKGPPERIKVAMEEAIRIITNHRRKRFVLSSGCTLTPNTPASHVEALCSCE